MAMLEVRRAGKVYQAEGERVAALRDVSFSADSGEFVALVGRSGCGKSTLLNLCGAMDFPTSGNIVIDGQSTTGLNDMRLTQIRREKVGFIFQSFQLMHTLTAVENVELPLQLAWRSDSRATALDRLRLVEMEAYAGRLPHQLSGGQQQRVAIARALALNPRLLLADEPTGNLDTATGELVLNLLRKSAHEFGVAVLMATHSSEGLAATDRVLKMRDGQMEP